MNFLLNFNSLMLIPTSTIFYILALIFFCGFVVVLLWYLLWNKKEKPSKQTKSWTIESAKKFLESNNIQVTTNSKDYLEKAEDNNEENNLEENNENVENKKVDEENPVTKKTSKNEVVKENNIKKVNKENLEKNTETKKPVAPKTTPKPTAKPIANPTKKTATKKTTKKD